MNYQLIMIKFIKDAENMTDFHFIEVIILSQAGRKKYKSLTQVNVSGSLYPSISILNL
jgi:hypothetical protein